MNLDWKHCGYVNVTIKDRQNEWIVDGIYRINRFKYLPVTVVLNKKDLSLVRLELQKGLRDFFDRILKGDYGDSSKKYPLMGVPEKRSN